MIYHILYFVLLISIICIIILSKNTFTPSTTFISKICDANVNWFENPFNKK